MGRLAAVTTKRFSTLAFRIVSNYVVYAMTHKWGRPPGLRRTSGPALVVRLHRERPLGVQ